MRMSMCIALKLGFSSTHRRAVSIPKYGQTPHSHTQQGDSFSRQVKFYELNILYVQHDPRKSIFKHLQPIFLNEF